MARYSISELLVMRPLGMEVPKRRQLIVSSDYSSVRSFNSLRGEARHIQWHLRRREASSDYQPRSAPSGIAAQQSENFQRFYRAVVSPTHVRVTAGGRIVPNTRAIAPPQPIFECKPELNFNRPPSLSATILPACSQPEPNRSALAATMAPLISGENELSRTFDTRDPPKMGVATKGDNAGSLTALIKISHPSQFDNSKPFMYNGHIVYPAPAGFQPPQGLQVPFTVLGNTNFMAQQTFPPPGFFPAQFPLPYSSGLMNSIMLPPSHLHPALQPLENLPPAAPYMPAPAMLSVAELTKHQIQTFRTHLKYLDNQIANNRHQIDEAYMTHQRNEVVSAIDRMEAMLDDQLAHEGNAGKGMLPNQKDAARTAANRLSDSVSSLPQKESPRGPTAESQPLFVKPQSVRVQIKAADGSEDKLCAIKAAEAARSAKQAAAIKSEPMVMSRLSAAAAKAPAFQPRAMKAAAKTEIAASTLPQNTMDRLLFSQTPATWTNPSSIEAVSPYGYSTIPKLYESYPPTQPQAYLPNFQRPQTFHGLPAALANGAMMSGHAVPYLVGTLPRGLSAREASPKDLVYGRELTEAELRARHVYWGKRQVVSGSGLPKFDGKDFYPPSPVKAPARTASTQEDADSYDNHDSPVVPIDLENLFTTPSNAGCRVASPGCSSDVPIDLENPFTAPSNAASRVTSPSRSSAVPIDLENLFTAPSYAGGRITSPVRSRPGLENILTTPQGFQSDKRGILTATPTQMFLDNTILGFKSPSPRPSSYRYEASSERNWPGAAATPLNYPPFTPPPANSNSAVAPVEDFSHLFLVRGEPGCRSPTPPRLVSGESRITGNSLSDAPITPTNHVASVHFVGSDTDSANSSEIVFTLSPKMAKSTRVRNGASFAERAANISSADQKLLHNMLKHTAATVSAPALSSATAQGYLPQYSGFAAASLSQPSNSLGGEVAPLIAANFLPENRPLNRDRPHVPIRPSPETMGAEAYMRHLAAKAEEDARIIAQGWDSNTTGTGPVTGSDW